MKQRSQKRTALVGVLALIGAIVGFIGVSTTPASAGTNGPTGYEIDCSSGVGQAAFIVGLSINATPDPSFPSGGQFGATGAAGLVLPGYFVAGMISNGVLHSDVSAVVNGAKIGGVDGTTTGVYTTNLSFAAQTPVTRVESTTYSSGATTLSGAFTPADVGSGVIGTGIPAGEQISAVDGSGNATLINVNGAAATTNSGTSVTVVAPLQLPPTGALSIPTTSFTANGSAGGQATIGLVGAGSVAITADFALPAFGGTSGFGTANCLLTGYADPFGTTPGPAQQGFAPGTPQLPAPAFGGFYTPLVAASGGTVSQPGTSVQITPPAAAFVNLADAPPTTSDASTNLGIGQSKIITLPTSDPDPTPTSSCSLVGSPSDARLNVTISNTPTPCQATITDSGSGPATVTFDFEAADGVGTGNTSTITVNIGTAGVTEPVSQQVNGGQLVLSCAAPTTLDLTCNEFQLPPVTLDGNAHTTTGAGSTLYVSDNRGDPTVGWTVTASVVATPIGPGSNTNASCANVVAFCNENVGSHALDASGNGQIAKGNLSIGSIGCTAHAGNLNPAATAGAGGSFSSTQTICTADPTESGGTFDVTKTYSLDVPSSVYAGKYWATVEFVVA